MNSDFCLITFFGNLILFLLLTRKVRSRGVYNVVGVPALRNVPEIVSVPTGGGGGYRHGG